MLLAGVDLPRLPPTGPGGATAQRSQITRLADARINIQNITKISCIVEKEQEARALRSCMMPSKSRRRSRPDGPRRPSLTTRHPPPSLRGMLPLTRHGFREMLIGSVVLAAVAFGLGYVFWPLALIVFPVLIWLFAFFRDPERAVPVDENIMVSPADGTVSDITEIDNDPLLGGPAVRVGIFLSVFNVHINRSPCDGKVLKVIYKKGKFINAMSHARASDENESNTVVLGEPTSGRPVAVVKQIVGLIARRIIFTAREGQLLSRGERIGMIKFGSRTELSIPQWLEPQVQVQVGQTVRGAADVIAKLGKPIHTTGEEGGRRGIRAAGPPGDARMMRRSPRRPLRADGSSSGGGGRPNAEDAREHRGCRIRRHGRRAYIRSVYSLPSLATLGNAICGFASMYVASLDLLDESSADPWTRFFFDHHFLAAAYLIFIAMLFDAVDGRLARFTRHTTDFGGQLDSLADVISFGCAPAFLALQLFHAEHLHLDAPMLTRLIWAIGALYMSCAAMRLARFNVSNEHGEQHHFSFLGLPSPGAAARSPGSCSCSSPFSNGPSMRPAHGTMRWLAFPRSASGSAGTRAVDGLLMVSAIRYPHLVNRYLRGRRSFGRLLAVLIILLMLVVSHRITLGVGAVGYALWGAMSWAWSRLRHRHGAPRFMGRCRSKQRDGPSGGAS